MTIPASKLEAWNQSNALDFLHYGCLSERTKSLALELLSRIFQGHFTPRKAERVAEIADGIESKLDNGEPLDEIEDEIIDMVQSFNIVGNILSEQAEEHLLALNFVKEERKAQAFPLGGVSARVKPFSD